jgi:DNA replication protein DnaC
LPKQLDKPTDLVDIMCTMCGELVCTYPEALRTDYRLQVCKKTVCQNRFSWQGLSPQGKIKQAVLHGVGELFIRDDKLPMLDTFGKNLPRPISSHDSHFICGPVGTGKSWLLACLACEALRAGRAPKSEILLNWQWLRIQIRSTYQGDGESEYDLLKRYSRLEFLCLDDLGSGKESEAERDLLYTLLDYRYSHRLTTNLSSNMTPGELSKRYDARIARRITELCKIVVLK